jgi:hypothetical protein
MSFNEYVYVGSYLEITDNAIIEDGVFQKKLKKFGLKCTELSGNVFVILFDSNVTHKELNHRVIDTTIEMSIDTVDFVETESYNKHRGFIRDFFSQTELKFGVVLYRKEYV